MTSVRNGTGGEKIKQYIWREKCNLLFGINVSDNCNVHMYVLHKLVTFDQFSC